MSDIRLKHVATSFCSGGTPDTSSAEYWAHGNEPGIPWVAISDMSSCEYVDATAKQITEAGRQSKRMEILDPGVLLYSMYASLGHVAELRIGATINQAILGIVLPATVDRRFMTWALRYLQPRVIADANSNTQDNLNAEKVRNLRFPFPTLARQRAIAAYLDRETAKIDAMIAAKDHQLSLLTEKRRAIITHAVTRGIDANAAMRDSGDEGLGVVPAHWTVCHLRRVLSDSTYGISATAGPDGTVPMLRMGDIVDGEIRYSKLAYVEEVDGSLLLNAGDLLFNRTNSLDPIGKVGIVRSSGVFPCTFASYLVRLRTNCMAAPDYLHQLLNSDYCLAWARGEAIPAIGQANLNPFRYGYMTIAVPPLHEQRMIVKHLADITSHIDAVALGTKHTVSLLKERRIALIAAAVSGQIDLEDAA